MTTLRRIWDRRRFIFHQLERLGTYITIVQAVAFLATHLHRGI